MNESAASSPKSAPELSYNPESIVTEEWERVVSPFLTKDFPAERVWNAIKKISADDQSLDVITPLSQNEYRILVRSYCHAYSAKMLRALAQSEIDQSDALKTSTRYDLVKRIGEAKCLRIDLQNACVREHNCAASETAEPPSPVLGQILDAILGK